MKTTDNFTEIVNKINQTLPLHRMWDGFWIHSFKKHTLIISCSFDKIYYRCFDLIFKRVVFFNVPSIWRDTNIIGDNLIRIASQNEFEQQYPGFDTQDHIIFAIDIYFGGNDLSEKHSFYILAKNIYLNQCVPPDDNPVPLYLDIYEDEPFPCMKNRILSE